MAANLAALQFRRERVAAGAERVWSRGEMAARGV